MATRGQQSSKMNQGQGDTLTQKPNKPKNRKKGSTKIPTSSYYEPLKDMQPDIDELSKPSLAKEGEQLQREEEREPLLGGKSQYSGQDKPKPVGDAGDNKVFPESVVFLTKLNNLEPEKVAQQEPHLRLRIPLQETGVSSEIPQKHMPKATTWKTASPLREATDNISRMMPDSVQQAMKDKSMGEMFSSLAINLLFVPLSFALKVGTWLSYPIRLGWTMFVVWFTLFLWLPLSLAYAMFVTPLLVRARRMLARGLGYVHSMLKEAEEETKREDKIVQQLHQLPSLRQRRPEARMIAPSGWVGTPGGQEEDRIDPVEMLKLLESLRQEVIDASGEVMQDMSAPSGNPWVQVSSVI